MLRVPPVARRALMTTAFALLGAAVAHAESPEASTPTAAPEGPKSLAIGASVPLSTTELQNIDGKPVTIAGVAGKKGTLVLFICNHCPWVKAWQPRIAEVGNAAKSKGIGVVAINANDPAAYPEDSFDEMVKRAREVGYRFAYAVDATSDVARAFGATKTPEAFLFDARGRLVYHGAIDDNAREPQSVSARWLAEAVNAVASGKKVAVAETKALGCGIKYRGEPAAH